MTTEMVRHQGRLVAVAPNVVILCQCGWERDVSLPAPIERFTNLMMGHYRETRHSPKGWGAHIKFGWNESDAERGD